jgi:SAM-dependent methyltransferase
MKRVIDYHDPIIEQYGLEHATGFSNHGQEQRFRVIRAEMYKPESILDYGCNVGDFRLCCLRTCPTYFGIDLNAKFIHAARFRFPSERFAVGNIADDDFYKKVYHERFQYVIASGVFCYDLGPSTLKTYKKIIQRLFTMATESMIFNVLRSSKNPENVTFDPYDITELIPQTCNLWKIIADYRENDATIVLRK